MDNRGFLKAISSSFKMFLETGSRSNEKLKILHKAIADDIVNRLGEEYSVSSLGVGDGKERTIKGRYIDKKVDITIIKNRKPVAGIGVKFVMQNYSQNSNNYFENMLGETANIRCADTPYFQIFIIPDKLPYYQNNGALQKWETFTGHNSEKYITLSKDNVDISIHTPNKTLLFVIHIPDAEIAIEDRKDYANYYSKMTNIDIKLSNIKFGVFSSAVIYNNYEIFAQKIVHRILSI